jgi:hypothetical protein
MSQGGRGRAPPLGGVWTDLAAPSLPPTSINPSVPISDSSFERMYHPQFGTSPPIRLSSVSQPSTSTNGRALPMSMFDGAGRNDDQNPRRGSHQAVEIAASALANLGSVGGSTSQNHIVGTNGNYTNNSQGADSTVAGPSQTDTAKGVDEASAASKKKRKPKQGDHLDDDGRRKTARACDQCVSRSSWLQTSHNRVILTSRNF